MPLSYNQLGNTFISTPSITIYSSGTQYAISGSASGIIISGTNVGTGNSFFTGLSTTTTLNDTLAFRNILAGPNINIALSVDNDGGDILISRGSPTLVNQISNIGGGARLLSGITSTNSASTRTISGANGFTSSTLTSPTIVLIKPTNTTANLLYISNATSQLTTNSVFGVNSTIGSIGIGGAAVTTSRLLLYAGTANKSQLRLEPFSTPISSPTDGDIWYSTSGYSLKFHKNNIATDFIFKDNNESLTSLTLNNIMLSDSAGTLTTKYIRSSFGVFNTLSSATVSNSTTETSLISNILSGSTTLLSSTDTYNPQLVTGKKFRFNAKGRIQIIDTEQAITINIKLGSTIIASTTTDQFSDPFGPSFLEIDATFTIRSTGATASVYGSGKVISENFLKGQVSEPSYILGIYPQTTVIDTTSNKIFDCTAQFGIADPSNTIIIDESTLEYLN